MNTLSQADTFTAKRAQSANSDVARLRGARFVTAVESDEGKRLAESQIKEMTGGDPLTARMMYRDFFDFKPDFKIFFATNHKPEIKGTDDGIWRRVRLIPFNVRFWNPDKGESGPAHLRADKSLPEKMRAELPGVLAWAVQGCLDWQREGLPAPRAVIAATDAYREEQDELAGFLADACIIGEGVRVTAKELGQAYEKWCDESGCKPLSTTAFGKKLRERGFLRSDTRSARGWAGIGLIENTLPLRQVATRFC